MTGRYGRNQRRAHREHVRGLEAELQLAKAQQRELARRASRAEARLGYAKEDAIKEWLKDTGRVDLFIREVRGKLVESVSPELRKYAEQVLAAASSQARRPLISLDAFQHLAVAEDLTVIRGTFTEVVWNMMVTP